MIVKVEYDTVTKFLKVTQDDVLADNIRELSFMTQNYEDPSKTNLYSMSLLQTSKDGLNDVNKTTVSYASLSKFVDNL